MSVFARLVNMTVAALGLTIFAPLFAVIAVAIAWNSGMPVFFRQPRVGRYGKTFLLVKFRSMRTGHVGNRITGAGDDRITSVGRFIRKYKLDELPQLWNVLNGEMSLVGPRPEVALFVDMSDPVWRIVLSVRPGITDLATLLYRNEERLLAGAGDLEAEYRQKILPDKLAANLEYLRVRNCWKDLKLVVLTLWCIIMPTRLDANRIRRQLYS